MTDGKSFTAAPSTKHPLAKKPEKKTAKIAALYLYLKVFLIYFALPVGLGVVSYYIYYTSYLLPSLVSTKCSLPTVLRENDFSVNSNPAMYWGTYMANLYFGTRSRHPLSPVVGLLWFEQPTDTDNLMPRLRHWCSQNDGLDRYGWLEHDARSFGVQNISDDGLSLETIFLKRLSEKHGGDWTMRISAASKSNTAEPKPRLFSFIIYVAVPGTHGSLSPKMAGPDAFNQHIELIRGHSPELGNFQIKLGNSNKNVVARNFLAATLRGMEGDFVNSNIENLLLSGMGILRLPKSKHVKQFVGLMGVYPPRQKEDGPVQSPSGQQYNFLAMQLTVLESTAFDLLFESEHTKSIRGSSLEGAVFDSVLLEHRTLFTEKFEKLFKLKERQYADVYMAMGKLALSNMLGSISFFHGKSKVISVHNKKPVPYGPFSLFTAIPSRSFFPRGFLWDEGFHHLLIKVWDSDLSVEILSSWLDLMNVEGWIPRETILGAEAEARVPEEYVVQNNAYANPPMFFLLFDQYISDAAQNTKLKAFLQKAYPRLKLWYSWLNSSQSGPLPGSYRWRGRNSTTTRELNPKTLTSGLDDYPRASHPTNDEYHLDLYCWMALSSKVMSKLADLVDDNNNYKEQAEFLNNQNVLDNLHWSPKSNRYCDFGLHTKNVKLERPRIEPTPNNRPPVNHELVRVTLREPKLRLVTDTFGYVSLFPLFFNLVVPDSPKLEALLNDIKNPDLLWTDYGLRSLAKNAPLYNQRNTEHDPPYWRGNIWINMNYLALRGLYHYSHTNGPYRDMAFEIYGKLRQNIIGNMVREYRRTGYLWEHYNDQTGKGGGTHPFTGWSSLVLLMMAERY